MAILAYAPMFYYFELSLQPPGFSVRRHGFYSSHFTNTATEYNDSGMQHVPLLFIDGEKSP